MSNVQQWLAEYGESHRHPINETIHWFCVPLIVFSVIGLLWSLPVPQRWPAISPWLNWASLAVLAALAYYFMLSPRLALGMILIAAMLLAGAHWLDGLAAPLWLISSLVFVGAWVGQFIGHHIEGRKPSFFKDVQFLLIGPIWLLATLYRRFSIRY